VVVVEVEVEVEVDVDVLVLVDVEVAKKSISIVHLKLFVSCYNVKATKKLIKCVFQSYS